MSTFDALPPLSNDERAELQKAWDLAAYARPIPPSDTAIEAAEQRFWETTTTPGANDVSANNDRPPMRQARRRWIQAAIVTLCLTIGFAGGWWLQQAPAITDERPAFLVLIRGGNFHHRSPAEQKAIVGEFRTWARTLAEAGHYESSAQLRPEGHLLSRHTQTVRHDAVSSTHDAVGGYFVLRADTYAQALTLAESCPHLNAGGTVEVRPMVN